MDFNPYNINNTQDIQKLISNEFENSDEKQQELVKAMQDYRLRSDLYSASLFSPKPEQLVDEEVSSSLNNGKGDKYWGSSMWDNKTATEEEFENLGDVRANNQWRIAKFGAGLGKMAIIAGTTFTDGILGTFAGIGNIAVKAINGNIHSKSDAFNTFVDNPLSRYLQNINEKAEDWLPNYYTMYEQTAPWYSQILTANFIGDKFLKNIGFTIGAAGAAALTAGGASKVLMKKGMRDAFKGAVNTAGKELKSGREIYNAYKTGDALLDGKKITEDLAKSAKQLRNAEFIIKSLAVSAGATGEGRIEALSAINDYLPAQLQLLEFAHKNAIANVDDILFEQHPEWFVMQAQYGPEGNIIGYTRQISNDYIQYKNSYLTQEQKNYEQALAKINQDAAKIGNAVFGLNFVLLSFGDWWQWGKMLTGGFNSGSIIKNLTRTAKDGSVELNKGLIRKTQARAIASPFVEMNEEMTQSAIQEGTKQHYTIDTNKKFGSFYNYQLDPEGRVETNGLLGSVLGAWCDQYSDIDNYEEGYLGFVTGLLGLPRIKKKADGSRSVEMGGEIWEGFREASQLKKEGQEIADAINKNIHNEEFANYYKSAVRHLAIQQELDSQLAARDEFGYKNSELKQLVSDAIMYDRAGRLQDLFDLIEQGANVTLDDVQAIRESTIDKKTNKSIFENLSDQEVVDKIKKQAEFMKNHINSYIKISNDLKTLYGDNLQTEVREELAYSMLQVNDWENRLQDLSKSMKDVLGEKANEIRDKFGVDINAVFGSNYSEFNEAFGNIYDEINKIIEDKSLSVVEQKNKIEHLIKKNLIEQEALQENTTNEINKIQENVNKIKEKIKKQRYSLLEELEEVSKKGKEKENKIYKPQEKFKTLQKELEELINSIKNLKLKLPILDELDVLIKDKEAFENRSVEFFDKLEKQIKLLEVKFKSFDKHYNSRYSTSILTTQDRILVGENNIKVQENNRKVQTNQKLTDLKSQFAILQRALFDNTEDAKNLINPIDKVKMESMFIDWFKILTMRNNFIELYNAVAENPEMFNAKFIKQLEETSKKQYEQHKKELKETLIEKLKSVKDIKTFRNVIKELQISNDIINDVLNDILNTENQDLADLKTIIKNYKELEKFKSILGTPDENIFPQDGIVKSLIDANPEEAESFHEIYKTLIDIINDSETLDIALEKINKYKNDDATDKAIKEKIDLILSEYEIVKAAEIEQEDNKNKKNKNKNEDEEEKLEEDDGKKPKIESEDDNEEDEEDENENEDEEQEIDEDNETEILKFLKNLSDEKLDSVIKGESNVKGYDKDEAIIKTVKELAQLILDQRKDEIRVKEQNTEETETDENINVGQPTEQKERLTFSNWYIQLYNFFEAANPKKRVLSYYKSTNTDHNEKVQHTLNILKQHNAFEFIDSGILGNIYQKFKKNNEKVPIYHLTTSQDLDQDKGLACVYLAIKKSDLKKKPKNSEYSLFTDDEIEEMFSNTNTITINNEEYQLVGTLGTYKGNEKSGDYRVNLWKKIQKETKSSRENNNEEWQVSKIINHISNMYSGRMICSSEIEGMEIEKKKRPIREILNGSPLRLFVYYDENRTDTHSPLGDGNQEIIKLNAKNKNPRKGSLWLLTKEADGNWYRKHVTVKRFNSREYNLKTYKDSPIMKHIKDACVTIVDDTKSDVERAMAKLMLQEFLYFPEQANVYFNKSGVSIKQKDGTFVPSVNYTKDNSEEKSVEERIEERTNQLLETLQTQNFRFQIRFRHLNENIYTNDILESDILETDVIGPGGINNDSKIPPHNICGSFEMPVLDENGKPLEESASTPLPTGQLAAGNKQKGHRTVYIDGVKYHVYYTDDTETEIKQITTETENKVIEKNSDVFTGIECDLFGKEDDLGIKRLNRIKKDVGVYDGTIYSGDALKELEDKRREEIDKSKQKESINSAMTTNPIDKMNDEEYENYKKETEHTLENLKNDNSLIKELSYNDVRYFLTAMYKIPNGYELNTELELLDRLSDTSPNNSSDESETNTPLTNDEDNTDKSENGKSIVIELLDTDDNSSTDNDSEKSDTDDKTSTSVNDIIGVANVSGNMGAFLFGRQEELNSETSQTLTEKNRENAQEDVKKCNTSTIKENAQKNVKN